MRKIFTLLVVLATSIFITASAASGIFVRGGLTNWGALPEYEFTESSAGVYTLSVGELYGSFKIADASWSTSCNFGMGSEPLVVGTPFALANGSNTNIDMGADTYVNVTLTFTLSAGTLLIEGTKKGDDEPLTTVYVIGDNNGWNFMDTSGALTLDENDGIYKGTVTMIELAEGFCFWRIYEGLGQKGTWGTTDYMNTTEHTLAGTLMKGSEGCITTTAGEYKVEFDISTGAFVLTSTSGVDTTVADEATVSASNGVISVAGASNVAVYTVGGALVSKNATEVSVASGVYVVKADGKAHKVVVK